MKIDINPWQVVLFVSLSHYLVMREKVLQIKLFFFLFFFGLCNCEKKITVSPHAISLLNCRKETQMIANYIFSKYKPKNKLKWPFKFSKRNIFKFFCTSIQFPLHVSILENILSLNTKFDITWYINLGITRIWTFQLYILKLFSMFFLAYLLIYLFLLADSFAVLK